MWLTQYETDVQVWQADKDGTVNACLTWTTYFMAADLPDSLITRPAAIGQPRVHSGDRLGMGRGRPLPERRQLSTQLVKMVIGG